MILYKLTNRKTGLSYIGATTKKRLNDRLALHRHRANLGERTSVLHEAIRQDGWASFDAEILARPSTFEELMAMETAAIAVDATMTPNGYNMTAGGLGQWSRPMTDKNKSAIIRSNSDRHPWNYGKKTGPMSQAVRQRMSESRKGRQPWNKGLAPSDLARSHQFAATPKRGDHPRARPIEYDGVTYACITDAAEATGLTKSQLNYRLQMGRAKDLRPKG